MAMKLPDVLQLHIVQLLRKLHRNILRNEGEGGNFLGLTLEKSQILNFQLSRRVAKLEYFANIFCRVVLFDVFYHNYHRWMEILLRI